MLETKTSVYLRNYKPHKMADKLEYTEQGWRYPVDRNRHHRENNWDYKGKGIYHITLVVAERKHLFGELTGDSADNARIELNSFGKQVYYKIHNTPRYYRSKGYNLKILALKVMPDHVHFVIYAVEPLPKSIGTVVRGIKSACTSVFKRCYVGGDDTTEHGRRAPLLPIFVQYASIFAKNNSIWEQTPAGYHERVLHRSGQLKNMIAYVKDNPRRLWLKKKFPAYFAVQRDVQYENLLFSAVGNLHLLESPLCAVHIRRRYSETEARDYMNNRIIAARNGAVLVGAFISPKEKQVLEVLLKEHLPIIVLVPYSFSNYYKPTGEFMESCAQGRVLFLSQTPDDVNPHKRITRNECSTLNSIAETMEENSNKLGRFVC